MSPISIPAGQWASFPVTNVIGLASDGTTQLPLTNRTATVDDYTKFFVAVTNGGGKLTIMGKTVLAAGTSEVHNLTINAKGSDGVTPVAPATVQVTLNGPPPPPQAATITIQDGGVAFGVPDSIGPHDPGAGTVSF